MAKKTKKHGSKSKKSGKGHGFFPHFSVETWVFSAVLFVAVVGALSPYLFHFWMTPETQKKVNHALMQTAFERAPASAGAVAAPAKTGKK